MPFSPLDVEFQQLCLVSNFPEKINPKSPIHLNCLNSTKLITTSFWCLKNSQVVLDITTKCYIRISSSSQFAEAGEKRRNPHKAWFLTMKGTKFGNLSVLDCVSSLSYSSLWNSQFKDLNLLCLHLKDFEVVGSQLKMP